MRQIQELRKLSGGRYLVVFEDGSCFPLYAKELDAFSIREGGTLSEKDFEKIQGELLTKRAKLCAMHFLQRMDRTEQQLRKKLETLFYPADVVETAVSYVKSYHYIDDVRYAVSFMEYRREEKSVRRMEQELLQKGISKETFREALAQIETPDEEQQIRRWLDKKHYASVCQDQKERERIYRFLLRKGYSSSAVRRAMDMEYLYE
ncbi:regulatory protein RecX [Parablautia sp. Marseille-Q6255]|uniref:regulatory protein RecX n=1 Tax=Parablautia sp. Marseille-Q6255 TaxID=3039593 RepID=UPI0024BD3139|nr:regulatory protein RecX [Parablautia sp. Marseille-Q6255]